MLFITKTAFPLSFFIPIYKVRVLLIYIKDHFSFQQRKVRAFGRSLFPLFVPIFSFLKKKGKGFPLQSGLGGGLWVCFWRLCACIAQNATIKIPNSNTMSNDKAEHFRRFRPLERFAVLKSPKNFLPQNTVFQHVKGNIKKTLKKDGQKACSSEKRCYFCTRNNGEVLQIY